MTYEEYLHAGGAYWLANRKQRQGQAYMNLLGEIRPELYERVTATNFDPFYNNLRLPNFLAWCEEVW